MPASPRLVTHDLSVVSFSAYAMLQWACASIGAILVTLNPAYRLPELVGVILVWGALSLGSRECLHYPERMDMVPALHIRTIERESASDGIMAGAFS